MTSSKTIWRLIVPDFPDGREKRGQSSSKDYLDEFPNINLAFKGYDVPRADPTAPGHDPGWRYEIFHAMEYTHGQWVISDAISKTKKQVCSSIEQEDVFHTVEEYKKVMGQGTSMSESGKFGTTVKVEAGYESGGAKVGASADIPMYAGSSSGSNKGTSDMEHFFESQEGAVVISEYKCATHEYKLNEYHFPRFTRTFLLAVSLMAQEKSNDSFISFVKHFGTHYSSETYLGAKLQKITKFSKKEKIELGAQQMKGCAKETSVTNVILVKFEKSETKCSSSSTDSKYLSGTKEKRTTINSFGAKPASTLDEWYKKTVVAPEPIQMKLEPIVKLFSKQGFKSMVKDAHRENVTFNVSRPAIIKFLVTSFSHYCDLFKDINCTVRKGCGYTDKCDLTQVCHEVESVAGKKEIRCLQQEKLRGSGKCFLGFKKIFFLRK